jgi:hypothetical protein
MSKRKKGVQVSALFSAVQDNNLERVKTILSTNGTDPNEKNGINEETALHLAATYGYLEILKVLLSHEAIEVDPKDIRGWTPLAIAQANDYKELANLLLESGATPVEQTRVKAYVPRTVSNWLSHSPAPPTESNRCTCCHYCRTSLSISPRQWKGCSSCPYVFCQHCFAKDYFKISWEEAQTTEEWICDVCMGQCLCSRCCTRGPPRWFGHKNPNWTTPETIEEEKKAYQAKAMKVLQTPSPPSTTLPRSPKDKKGKPYEYQQMCSCCHLCRKSVSSTKTPYRSCSTCAYIICKGCFGRKLKETWEESLQAQNWSCTVCHGTCNCDRCKKRGPPGWYGQLNKLRKETNGNHEVFKTDHETSFNDDAPITDSQPFADTEASELSIPLLEEHAIMRAQSAPVVKEEEPVEDPIGEDSSPTDPATFFDTDPNSFLFVEESLAPDAMFGEVTFIK